MRKQIMVNHKMNMNINEIKHFIDIIPNLTFKPIVFPTSLYLPYFVKNNIKVGAQNVYFENEGAYTGEISPKQVKDLGAEYVLIGHSERRRIFGETDDMVNLKVKKSLENNLNVILCVGEHLGENYKEIIKKQISVGLKGIKKEVIVCYEPVYSIGTGIIPDKEEIIKIISYIKSLFNYDVKVLYGGGINLKNAEVLKEIDIVDGYLIGSSSLDVNELIKIGEVLL